MRILGLIGGMSWESSLVYYRLINCGVRDRLGPLRSAKLLLDSVDFGEIEPLQRSGNWPKAGEQLAASARRLQAGGAEAIMLATNTMHKVAEAITAATPLPFLHIADPTGSAMRAANSQTVLLLGTAFTMEQDFYRNRLAAAFGIHCLIPPPAPRQEVHRIIYQELCTGIVNAASRAAVVAMIGEAAGQGASGVILGCTELTLLIGAKDSPLPVFDTTALHAAAGVDFILGDEQ